MFSFLFKYKHDFVRLDNNKTIFLDNTRFTKKITSVVQPILVTKELINASRLNSVSEDTFSFLNIHFNKENLSKFFSYV